MLSIFELIKKTAVNIVGEKIAGTEDKVVLGEQAPVLWWNFVLFFLIDTEMYTVTKPLACVCVQKTAAKVFLFTLFATKKEIHSHDSRWN